MEKFLEPYHFSNGMQINNRIVMAPMTTQSSFFDGSVTTDELQFYRRRSGVGMIITAVANVNSRGKGFEGELSAADDRLLPSLTELAGAIKTRGSKAILQLFSAGRMTNSKILRGVQPQSASAIAAVRPQAEIPAEMTNAEIEQLIVDFGKATRRAILAGFDGVELHGANTYLLQQFFSPHSNRRHDKWGGNLQNRLRLPLAVVEEAHQVIRRYARHPFLLGYRFSPEEIETPGIRLTDTLELVEALASSPLDYLHTSLGSAWRPALQSKESPLPINQQILTVLQQRKPLIVVGSLATPIEVSKTISQGATFAAMGRELLREPEWLEKIRAGQTEHLRYQLDRQEMDELDIPKAMQYFLETNFAETMDFS
ncbi:NADH-dependent flavin oxidoreductase [Liquorilactobacillus nagelii]|jgi:2,4-dienoyl-CoA reductase-like NADH-dependent reductase (Old Yellow Enzyme family)|uniref:NADH-dependent flavin oxidoreductase n=1 Tax=Liquorilactobacillus nagelii TaxID=82688 RepID=UPI0039E9212F